MNINEIKLSKQKGRQLCESISVGLTNKQKRVVEGVYKTLEPLLEVQLTPDQITQLFGQIEQGATAGGGNRTIVGKGIDTVKTVNDTITKVGQWLQDTAPVQAFDQKFEQLKTSIGQKFPELDKNLTAMGTWAKENPGKTAAIIGVLTTIAALAGGPAGGAIAGQILKGTSELLKGEKLSTAIGKGVKTAALGFITGKVAEMLGNWISGFREKLIPFGEGDAGLEYASWGASSEKVSAFGNWTRNTRGFDVLVTADDASAIRAAMDGISNGDAGAFDRLYEIAKYIQSDEYDDVIDGLVAGAWKEAKNNDSLLQFINTVKQGVQAGAQGAATAAASNEQPTTAAQPAQQTEGLSAKQISALFEHIVIEAGLWDKFKQGAGAAVTQVVGATPGQIAGAAKGAAGAVGQKLAQVGKNITTKVTADKLQAAWQKAGSPTDSEAIADILTAQGVDPTVVNSAFQSASIKRIDRTKLPDVSKLTAQQKQELMAQLDALDKGVTAAPTATATAAPTATAAKTRTGGKVAGQVSQTPSAVRQRQARATKSAAPAAPTAPAQQLPGDRTTPMSQLIKQRQAQGLAEGYQDFKKKLNKELKR